MFSITNLKYGCYAGRRTTLMAGDAAIQCHVLIAILKTKFLKPWNILFENRVLYN
jgi:hypothetical protein